LTREGFLERCSEREALEILLAGIATRTPHGKWIGSGHFGLRDFFEDARTRPERVEQLRSELNLALGELGVRYRLEGIVRQSQSGPGGVDSLALSFSLEGEQEPVVLKL
jgi:hypothetical protein